MQQYLFGDTNIAAQRLKVLAEVFANSTTAFLTRVAGANPRLTVDLGCGPGYCTHMLATMLRPARTVGLDNSKHFLSHARQSETEDVSFRLHDVTSVPFPVDSTDLAYCRFLLSHLTGPGEVVASWTTQLHPKGQLVIEEVEAIQTSNPTFTTYLGIVEAMLADQNSCLYVGPAVARFCTDAGLVPRVSQVKRFPVPNDRAATMFFLNLQSWRNQPFVHANFGKQEIARLEERLREIAADDNGRSEIKWDLRQVAFTRR
jgi:ubiquinone/menaquinone biosynthesis C-methylase UbiE